MKHNSKNNKRRNKVTRTKSVFLIPAMHHLQFNINNPHKGLKKGFVAWPENNSAMESEETNILEGRTYGGGYVALPGKLNH
jgi:hypothetical protein